MTTYCRITGKSRGLPKANYFPLLPPISPADAKRFCRITGKAYGLPGHHYIPVLVGKPKSKKNNQLKPHAVLAGYKYYFPCLEETSGLSDLLTQKKNDSTAKYVYTVKERKCGLVFPAQLEEAVRDGDVKDVMLAKDADTVLVKLRKGSQVSLDVKMCNVKDMTGELWEGEGARKVKTKKGGNLEMITQIFQDKEDLAEAEAEAMEPKPKPVQVKPKWNEVTVNEDLHIPEPAKFTNWEWNEYSNFEGKPTVPVLPTPIRVSGVELDLNTASPGLIQQPTSIGETATGLEVTSVLSPFVPLEEKPQQTIVKSVNAMDMEQLERTKHVNRVFKEEEAKKLLPAISEILDLVGKLQDGVEIMIGDNGQSVHGIMIKNNGEEKFVVGQTLETNKGPVFVPGQTVCTGSSSMFVPGITVHSADGPKLIPGQAVTIGNDTAFVAGRITLTREGESFVPGQTIATDEGSKFMPGQTIVTKNGLKFVPGQSCGNEFISGQVVSTSDGVRFVTGQTVQTATGQAFIPGVSVNGDEGWEFIPGKTVGVGPGAKFVPGRVTGSNCSDDLFVPGQYVELNGESIFVPGVSVEGTEGLKFIPGTNICTPEGVKFVEGQVLSDGKQCKFVPGTRVNTETGTEFKQASSVEELACKDTEQVAKQQATSALEPCEVFGQMVQSTHGVEFFPGHTMALPAGKVVSGKLVRIKGEQVKFVPGIINEGKFVPGQVVMTDTGEQFIPGQVVETTEGPKFVPGQIIETHNGGKFVPGQTVQTEEGPKFVPGQIVETNAGPTFIPGQVIHTEGEGAKFVPGQVVETTDGPRFVPGRVVESGDHVSFIPGQVVETSEGLRFVAPDLAEDGDDFTVQGYEISPEELNLLHPCNRETNATEVREMAIDSRMLRQLSEAGMAIGRQVPTEIPEIDIRSAPAMSAAWALSKRLSLDPVSTAKVSQIYSAILKVSRFGEIEGKSEAIAVVNTIIERIEECETEEKVYETISAFIEKEFKERLVPIIDQVHTYLYSNDSVLKKLNKLNLLRESINGNNKPEEIIAKLSVVLEEDANSVTTALKHLVESNPQIIESIVQRVNESVAEVQSDKEAADTVHRAIVATVREASEMSIVDLLKDTENLGLRELILGAVSLAKALDMSEAAAGLLDILSNPKCTHVLAGDRITLEILRRLTVMRQLAEKRPELLIALKNMQTDPYKARSDPSLRQLVRESGALMVIPDEEELTTQTVPTSLLFSQNSLAMEELLTRTKRAYRILVIIKNGIQAIIPRESAHSVLTGSVPYAVLDDKGLHYFQPKHVFNAIRLPKLATHWFSMYNCEYKERESSESVIDDQSDELSIVE